MYLDTDKKNFDSSYVFKIAIKKNPEGVYDNFHVSTLLERIWNHVTKFQVMGSVLVKGPIQSLDHTSLYLYASEVSLFWVVTKQKRAGFWKEFELWVIANSDSSGL